MTIHRAIELNLAPELRAMLWFRYSVGSRAPKHPEHIVTFLLEPVGNSTTSGGDYALRILFREATVPVLDQVAAALESSADLSTEQVAQKVQIRTISILEADCPAIQEAYRSFSDRAGSALSLELEDMPLYHGPTYRIEGYAEGMRSFRLVVTQSNPLFQWAERTHTAVEACAGA